MTADTVISPGDMLAVTAALRVGRRIDRVIELTLSVPDTFPAGVYRLEAGSAATLAEDVAGGDGPPPLFGLFGPSDGFGSEETLDDVFGRVNGEDKNVVLKARLMFAMPFEAPADSTALPEGGLLGVLTGGLGGGIPQQGPAATVSTQKDVDLFLEGSKSLSLKVVTSTGP